MKVYLICAGGHAKQVIDVFLESGYEVLGAFDDHKTGIFYRKIPILGKLHDIESVGTNIPFFCTLGDNVLRQSLCTQYKDLQWVNCISPHAYVSPSVKMGHGNYIGVHTRLLGDTVLGNFNIINEGATLTHDNQIGDFNHVAPNASLGGRVRVGHLNLIGTHATINPNLTLGDRLIIGSGAVVIKSLLEPGTYVGVPSKKLEGKLP